MQNDRLSKLLDFLEADAADPFVLYAIATEYNALNDEENALHYYLRLTAEHPGYVGTYYHLGKLYERTGAMDKAISTYQAGMMKAQAKRDMHALSELRAAYNEATGFDDEDD